jgi:putative transposase
MNEPDPIALFRLTLLGPVVARGKNLERGELQRFFREVSSKEYEIPGSDRRRVSAKAVQSWYYAFLRGGLAGLAPKTRLDIGRSKIDQAVQERLLAAKRENPIRSLNILLMLVEGEGLVAPGAISRSAIHRLLQAHDLSRPSGAASQPQERRSFEAKHAGDIWYGDVMHGPRVLVEGRRRKTYLVSLMDDASRLITHSAFCLAEQAVDIEAVLKQAVLKCGRPRVLIVDNGSAYRSGSLQKICAMLDIRLIYCKPYSPEAKGKLERWHRTARSQYLSEINPSNLDIGELNAGLWAWIEQVYHRTPHSGINDRTPNERFGEDYPEIRQLGPLAAKLDTIFLHRVKRKVRKDATVSYGGCYFEVPFELTGKKLWLVVDPHTRTAISVEDDAGKHLGAVTPLDRLANRSRRRIHSRPTPVDAENSGFKGTGPTLVDLARARHYGTPINPDSSADKTGSRG